MIPKRQANRPTPRTLPSNSIAAEDETRPTTGPRPVTYELIERVTSLQLKMAPLDVLADAIVEPLLDAFAAPSGGLLLYHSDDSSLRLTASRGLSAHGREQLASLRAGAAGGWEIPLHGLMNRKAYIIERPHEHPFVPELIERDEARPPANLACIPLYRGQLPVGVLLLIADRRPVTNAEVMTHVLVYDVLALALDAGLRARGEAPAPLPEAVVAELTCDEWADPRDTARSLQHELALVTSERIELGERVAALESAHSEARGLLAAQKTLHRDLLEAERAEAARRIAELERTTAEELARARQVAEHARSGERAGFDEQLAQERSAAATTIRELERTLADREAAFAGAVQKLQTALQERETVLAERERQLGELGGERDRVQQAAADVGGVVRGLQAEIERLKAAQVAAESDRHRTFDETQAAFERQLAEVTTEHRRQLERAETAHATAVAEVRAAERQSDELGHELAAMREEAAGLRAERSQVLATLDAPGVEPATAVRALRERMVALQIELDELGTARGELERQLIAETQAAEARQSQQRREFHEVHAAHERAMDDLVAEHRHALEEARVIARRDLEHAETAARAQLSEAQDEAQRKLEQERFEAQQRIDTFRIETRQQLDDAREAFAEAAARATAAETRADGLADELAAVRTEVARLSEERAHVLAAVDDPSAEPATVIRALRDQVAGLESQVGMLATERTALERRNAAEAQAAESRIAELQATVETRLAEARAAAQVSLDDARWAAETTLAEVRAALAERDALVAARDHALSELVQDRDQNRRAAIENGDALRRSQGEAERVRAELANVEASEREARMHAAASAERLLELDRELGTARTELGRLHEERARVLAVVDDAGTEPVAVIRALREQAAALEVQVRALAGERTVLTERMAAERAALETRLHAVEQDRAAAEEQRAEQTTRIAALERDLIRSDEMLASARRQLDAAVERARTETRAVPAAPSAPAAPASAAATTVAAPAPARPVAPAVEVAASLPRIEVLSPPPAPVIESAGHRILEADPLVRERVAAALAAELPDPASPLFVVNLLSAMPDRLHELDAAVSDGVTPVSYAAEAGRSRVLGSIHCFSTPPTPETLAAAVAKLGAQRRLISLSDDVDGLIPLKGVLSKAGHSISMACDTKQAIDLLGMLTPDAVLVDLRSAPEAAVPFLDALALENGRTPVFLVCGDDPGSTLRRAIAPLLRPTPLDATALAKACQTIIAPPAPEAAARNAAGPRVRPIDRSKTAAAVATRKPLPRRILGTGKRR